jgi:hypothetical protein
MVAASLLSHLAVSGERWGRGKKFVVLKIGISYISGDLVCLSKIYAFKKGKSEIDIKKQNLKYELLY